jgi:hypothetical protein
MASAIQDLSTHYYQVSNPSRIGTKLFASDRRVPYSTLVTEGAEAKVAEVDSVKE